MSEEELHKWFWNKFNNCYAVKHEDFPGSIFWFYDEPFARKHKLCRLSNQKVTLPSKVSGICLFEENLKNKYFNCNRDIIWKYFEDNYSTDYYNIEFLINEWLNETDKFSNFKPESTYPLFSIRLKDKNKLSIL